jgi:hypothetical protein
MLRRIKLDSDHMNVSRSMSFLINGQPLKPEEHSHLFGCEDCMKSTVEAVLAEMDKRRQAAELEHHAIRTL